MQTIPSDFADRLDIAQANVSTNGPIHPQTLYAGVLQNPRAAVLLSEVAAAAIRWGWPIPEAMQALTQTDAPVTTSKYQSTYTPQQKRQLDAMRVPPDRGMTISSQWLKEVPPAPVETPEPTEVKAPTVSVAVPKQRAQELRIIELLKAQGYDPLKLTQRPAGKPGPKAEIRTLALNDRALFTPKTFDTAWQRLRDVGELAGAE